MARCVAHFTAPSVCPRRHVQPEEYSKPRRCVKMMSSSQVPVLRIQSFSGLRPSNALMDLTTCPAQDFLSKVNLSISSRKGRASRCVTKAIFERCTEKSIKVIILAQEEARRLGHNFVGTEQILLGLIGERTGISAKVLKSMGITLEDARVEVEKIIGRGSGFVPAEIPLTPRAKRVLESSLEEARQPGQNDFGPEHQTTLVLLGLLREGESVAARAKRVLESSLEEARQPGHNYIGPERILLRLLRKGENAAALAKGILELPRNGGRQLGHNDIGPEHILLALLREEKGVAARVLKNLGADPSNIRRQVIRMVEENIEGM